MSFLEKFMHPFFLTYLNEEEEKSYIEKTNQLDSKMLLASLYFCVFIIIFLIIIQAIITHIFSLYNLAILLITIISLFAIKKCLTSSYKIYSK